MKRYVFKWGSIFCLLCLAVFCAYLYSNLSPDYIYTPTPSTPVVGSPSEDDLVMTTFPKAPLLEPFSGCRYLLPITGSGDDEIVEVLTFGGYVFVFGNTDSPDYDFGVLEKSLFVAKIDNCGVLERVTTKVGAFLTAKATPFGIVVVSKCDTGIEIMVFDWELKLIDSLSLPSNSAEIVLTSSNVTLVTTAPSSVVEYTVDTGFNLRPLDTNLTEIVALHYIADTIYVVANTDTLPVVVTISDTITKCEVMSLSHVVGGIPFFDKELGFLLFGTNGAKATISAIFNGKSGWTKSFIDCEDLGFVPFSDGYLLFIKGGTSSTCIRLCSHGDVVESCILPFTNLFPVDWSISGDTLYLLFEDTIYNKSTIATYNATVGACVLYQFDPHPACFVATPNNLLLGVTSNAPTQNFSSGVGGMDSFLICLK